MDLEPAREYPGFEGYREPTPEECSSNARVGNAVACWYPQMGGYVGRALIRVTGCSDVLVWHDGEFPFSGRKPVPGGEVNPRSKNPVELHHCDGDQFIRFGELMNRLELYQEEGEICEIPDCGCSGKAHA